jgi:hypothetical protein
LAIIWSVSCATREPEKGKKKKNRKPKTENELSAKVVEEGEERRGTTRRKKGDMTCLIAMVEHGKRQDMAGYRQGLCVVLPERLTGSRRGVLRLERRTAGRTRWRSWQDEANGWRGECFEISSRRERER